MYGAALLGNVETTKYRQRIGFRFCFREATTEHWEEFERAVSVHFRDHPNHDKNGLHDMSEDDHVPRDVLESINIERTWEWYSSSIMKIAKKKLPGRVVGRTGLRPEAEMNLSFLVRSLASLQRAAKMMRQGLYAAPDKKEEIQKQVDTALSRVQAYFKRMEENGEEVPIDPPPFAPTSLDGEEQWKSWSKDIGKLWEQGCAAVQVFKAARLQARIKENIGNLFERW
ncbi:hypothetical protein BGX28_002008, partial [Mortierella sp. GBA30]